jgi:hypothetical protein
MARLRSSQRVLAARGAAVAGADVVFLNRDPFVLGPMQLGTPVGDLQAVEAVAMSPRAILECCACLSRGGWGTRRPQGRAWLAVRPLL